LDGSGQNGQMGTVAVLYRHGVEQGLLRKQLGSEEWHTIFKAEVLGLSIAVKLISKESQVRSTIIRGEQPSHAPRGQADQGSTRTVLTGLLPQANEIHMTQECQH